VIIHTIGFTKKTAQSFFSKLTESGVRRLIDVRLNNVSQLAGFSKRDDLQYFARVICDIDYVHLLEMAPTQEILARYRKQKGDWSRYEKEFLSLMKARRIEERIPPDLLDGGCLLCSEENPDRCHRRLVAEYLKARWGEVEIHHIL
jgi:uncharacterized protein (DUF488 family)